MKGKLKVLGRRRWRWHGEEMAWAWKGNGKLETRRI